MVPLLCERRELPLEQSDRTKHNSGHFGFYTTRWVEAVSVEAAETKCVDVTRQDADLAHLDRVEGVTPMIYVEEIDELRGKPETHTGSGFTFFPMES